MRIIFITATVFTLLSSIHATQPLRAQLKISDYLPVIRPTTFSLDAEDTHKITGMGFVSGTLYVAIDLDYILAMDHTGKKIFQFGGDKYSTLHSYSMAISPLGDILTADKYEGKFYVTVFSPSGEFLTRMEYHPNLKRIHAHDNGDIYIGGLRIYGYNAVQKKYDKNTWFPSRKDRKALEQFYENASGHWITVLNADYEKRDSLLFTRGKMRTKEFAARWQMFAFDLDTTGRLWVFRYPKNNITAYDSSLQVTDSLALMEPDCNIPSFIDDIKAWYRLEKQEAFSYSYILHVLEPYVFLSYKTGYRDLTDATRRMAVYTTDGEFVDRFDFPYRPFRHEDALYFWMKNGDQLQLMKCSQ